MSEQALSTHAVERIVTRMLRTQNSRRYRIYRIVHDEDCDFANTIVGQEVDGVTVVAYRPDIPPQPFRCSCRANPSLVDGFK